MVTATIVQSNSWPLAKFWTFNQIGLAIGYVVSLMVWTSLVYAPEHALQVHKCTVLD